MQRVLVTGGAGTLGAAVVRRLLRDPDYEVRISDQRDAPPWMREGCAVHRGDLRVLSEARKAFAGCSHVVHLAGIVDRAANPHTLTEVNNALSNAVVRAALDADVARFLYVSSATVYERADVFPTPEEHAWECPPPRSAYAFSKLTGEVYCRAAAQEHGLRYTIVRPFNPYGPGASDDAVVPDLIRKSLAGVNPMPIYGSGEQTRTFTYLDDVADGVVRALGAPEAEGEAFNHAWREETPVAELARLCWAACGRDPDELALVGEPSPKEIDPPRRFASVEKARELLGWEAQVDVEEGVARTVEPLRAAELAGTVRT
jgi:nucleoside-diphosphate-sugar epimerase